MKGVRKKKVWSRKWQAIFRELDFQQRIAPVRVKVVRAGLVHEKFRPGRFSDYYAHGYGVVLPVFFMSLEGEQKLRGSTPGGFLEKWAAEKRIDLNTIDRKVPQICVIPKKEIGRFLLAQLVSGIETPKKRGQIEKMGKKIKGIAVSMVRRNLAAIDWAEQTYGIRISVPQEILDWVEKLSR